MSFVRHRIALSAAVLLPALCPAASLAQETGEAVRQEHRIPLPPTLEIMARGADISPGISIASPTGFGARWGDGFVGVAYQYRTRTFTRQDGGVAAGFGIGDPARLVGLEVVATTFGTVQTCCRGGVSFKVHRLLGRSASVALGYENALLWNDGEGRRAATDAGQSLYGAASKVFLLRPDGAYPFPTMTLTVGAGNGRFRREKDIVEDRSTINPFAAASLRLSARTSAIADWTGRDLAAGVSVVPFRGKPLFITPAVADLTTRPRFIVGAGFGFNYSGVFF